MEAKVYYISGSKEDPESVKKALYEVCPNVENPSGLTFETERGIYFILNNKIRYVSWSDAGIEVIKMFGEELQPKKTEKLTEKIMYSPVYDFIENGDFKAGSRLFLTKEEALADAGSMGYQEIKVTIKE